MPPSELHEQILAAYLDGAQSPFSIARDFGLTIEQFIAFITSPEIAARIRALETLCRERARTLAVLHLPEAAGSSPTRYEAQVRWRPAARHPPSSVKPTDPHPAQPLPNTLRRSPQTPPARPAHRTRTRRRLSRSRAPQT
jgi:hypothetical protein